MEMKYQVLAFRQQEQSPIQVAFVAYSADILSWAGVPRKSDELLTGFQRFRDQKRIASCSSTELLFVTQNRADFGDAPSLHPDLAAEAESAGLDRNRIVLYNSLAALNAERVVPRLRHLDEMMEAFGNEETDPFGIREWLRDTLADLLEAQKLGPFIADIEDISCGAVVTRILPSFRFDVIVDDVWSLRDNSLMIVAETVDTYAVVDVEIPSDVTKRDPERFTRMLDEEAVESGANAYGSVIASVSVGVTLLVGQLATEGHSNSGVAIGGAVDHIEVSSEETRRGPARRTIQPHPGVFRRKESAT